MKSPDQLPSTSGIAVTGGDAPTLQADDNNAAAGNTSATSSAAAGAATVAVWNRDKRVNGLYTTRQAHNAWMSIAGTGWQHLATSFDSACEVMTAYAAHAREKNSRIDYSVDAGLVNEIYIW